MLQSDEFGEGLRKTRGSVSHRDGWFPYTTSA